MKINHSEPDAFIIQRAIDFEEDPVNFTVGSGCYTITMQ